MKESLNEFSNNKFKEEYERLEPLFESFRKAFIYIAREMKEVIDHGIYDYVVSDESGGRIPSLILWNIMKLANKNYHPKLVFIPGNKFEASNNLKGVDLKGKNIVIVTEFINEGDTVRNMAAAARDGGTNIVDLCVTQDIRPDLGVDSIFSLTGDYVDANIMGFAERHSILSGVIKDKKGNRILTLENFVKDNPQKIFNVFVDDDFDLDGFSLSEADIFILRENVFRTRNAIKKIAEEVYKEVWRNK